MHCTLLQNYHHHHQRKHHTLSSILFYPSIFYLRLLSPSAFFKPLYPPFSHATYRCFRFLLSSSSPQIHIHPYLLTPPTLPFLANINSQSSTNSCIQNCSQLLAPRLNHPRASSFCGEVPLSYQSHTNPPYDRLRRFLVFSFLWYQTWPDQSAHLWKTLFLAIGAWALSFQ